MGHCHYFDLDTRHSDPLSWALYVYGTCTFVEEILDICDSMSKVEDRGLSCLYRDPQATEFVLYVVALGLLYVALGGFDVILLRMGDSYSCI